MSFLTEKTSVLTEKHVWYVILGSFNTCLLSLIAIGQIALELQSDENQEKKLRAVQTLPQNFSRMRGGLRVLDRKLVFVNTVQSLRCDCEVVSTNRKVQRMPPLPKIAEK